MIPLLPFILGAIALGVVAAKRETAAAPAPDPAPLPDPPAPPQVDPSPSDPQLEPDETVDIERTSNFDAFQHAYAKTEYRTLIESAEEKYNLPQNILARLLWEESRYDAKAIGPETKYGTAKGIAQFLDSTSSEYGIDPFDPAAAIPAAAQYLRYLWKQTGAWLDALYAYNWGIGNVQRKGIEQAPEETVRYANAIYADSEADA